MQTKSFPGVEWGIIAADECIQHGETFGKLWCMWCHYYYTQQNVTFNCRDKLFLSFFVSIGWKKSVKFIECFIVVVILKENIVQLISCPRYICWGASVEREQQHTQDLRRIYYVERGTNSRIHHFLPECIAFNQSARRHFLPGDVVTSSRPRFRVASGEASKPIQCSHRILFKVGGVLLNLSFGNTPWFDSTLRNEG